jgi:hypothetical protein
MLQQSERTACAPRVAYLPVRVHLAEAAHASGLPALPTAFAPDLRHLALRAVREVAWVWVGFGCELAEVQEGRGVFEWCCAGDVALHGGGSSSWIYIYRLGSVHRYTVVQIFLGIRTVYISRLNVMLASVELLDIYMTR